MDEQTIDTYNRTAKEYDEKTSTFWTRFPRTIIDVFTERAIGTVLDVGSGPGRDGLLLQEKGLKVICLDASKEMVKLSRSKGLPSFVGDFMELPFAAASFGGVWSYNSLLHVPKIEIKNALAEIYRVLKPGGVFGLGLIEGDEEYYRTSLGEDSARWFSFYTKQEVEALLTKNGFTIEYFESISPGTKDYLHFIARK